MTKEQAIEQLKHDRDLCNFDPFTGESEPISEDCRKSAEALDYAIKALEQQPCEDCVSRQAVEKITWEDPSYSDALNVLTEVRDKVRALPSVTPTCKVGKWIRVSGGCKCPFCDMAFSRLKEDCSDNFCPNCGAEMRGDSDGSN